MDSKFDLERSRTRKTGPEVIVSRDRFGLCICYLIGYDLIPSQ